jgi:hypothetical protein
VKREKYKKACEKEMRNKTGCGEKREKGCDNEDSSYVTHIR